MPARLKNADDDRHLKVRTGASLSQSVQDGESSSEHFCRNAVSTQKYTFCNFLPKNTFEQFRKLANVYFGIVCVLQVFTVSLGE